MPFGIQKIEFPIISRHSAHEYEQVVSPMHRPPLLARDNPGTFFCYKLGLLQCHSAAGMIKSIKNPGEPVGIRTRDFTACNPAPQTTSPRRTPRSNKIRKQIHHFVNILWGPGIAQSVWRLATSLTLRGSNPGRGETFRNRSDRPCDTPSLLYNGYRVFPGGKAAGAWRRPPTSISRRG
jgi:hypothetical protein